MTTVKRIVCLANSRKLHGRCIAGRELVDRSPDAWVRPVSSREHQEVSERERHYEDGTDPAVLDVIDVPLIAHKPSTYQQENWLLDPTHYWVKQGRVGWDDLPRLASPERPLWVDGHSTYHGRNDRIPLVVADSLTSSLAFIHVDGVELAVFAPGSAFGDSKRRVQARFSHAGAAYKLWVTDPAYERRFLAQPDAQHHLGECFLTVSLGEPYKGDCYKLVAAILEQATPTRGTA
jgi:hypothetical protein